jgi:hypothetical protein
MTAHEATPPGDPTGIAEAHDVLAADEFPIPAGRPKLRTPSQLPEDPTGIAEPHDILAAEEFPMPAPPADRPTG